MFLTSTWQLEKMAYSNVNMGTLRENDSSRNCCKKTDTNTRSRGHMARKP